MSEVKKLIDWDRALRFHQNGYADDGVTRLKALFDDSPDIEKIIDEVYTLLASYCGEIEDDYDEGYMHAVHMFKVKLLERIKS